jgi:hypothetical protein
MILGILYDVFVTIQGAGTDDGTFGPLVGSATTVKIDKITPKFQRTTADYSTGQDAVPMHRTNKQPFSLAFETKLNSDGLVLGILEANPLIRVIITAVGANEQLDMIVTEFTPEYAGPSTLSFSAEPYGVTPIITTSD